MHHLPLTFLFISLLKLVKAQQSYSGNAVMTCYGSDATGPSPSFLYTCNVELQQPSCQSFLIYKSQHRYKKISKIANLTSSDPFRISQINNISISLPPLPENKEVIVPVNCSCSGQYYQANASYTIQSVHETYFTVANYTYEGLSTCNALKRENNYSEDSLDVGMKLRVPLRCACPTTSQASNGTKYLLTYLVSWGDTVHNVSERFNASVESVAYANGFTEDDPVIVPFTTMLVPLSAEPSQSQTIIHHPPPQSSVPSLSIHPVNKKSSKRYHSWIVLGTSLMFLLFILSIILLFHKKPDLGLRKHRKEKRKPVLPEDFMDCVAKVDPGMKIYTFEELQSATEDFSSENRISSAVYRGIISGQVVAIKKMSEDVSNEVNLLRKANHCNLISLYAACQHLGACYLVYEFMEKGSLKDWLQAESSCFEYRSWSHRIQIALDVANGLQYLHNFTNPPYVHKDISSSNILLNRYLRAKIANFSLAHSAEYEEYVNSSKRLSVGSRGYMAPEYMESGLVTLAIDIYAFGVVFLELITGKEAVFMENGREVLLSEAIISIFEEEEEEEDAEAALERFIDPNLLPKNWMEHIRRMVRLSLACLAREPENRMSTAEIVSTLLKIQLDVQISVPFFPDSA